MREQEKYWSFKSPPIPEARDLPEGAFKGDENRWGSLSPGMRREIWRDAIQREAVGRQLQDDILYRLRVATISGSLNSLDEYLMMFERQDVARPAIREDAERLHRADNMQHKNDVQITARETL